MLTVKFYQRKRYDRITSRVEEMCRIFVHTTFSGFIPGIK